MNSRIDTDLLRLKDILQAIEDAEQFYKNNERSRQAVYATAYAIAIMGEAANKLSDDLKQQNKNIPWREIIAMRNRIIHDYGNINTKRLEEVVQRHLPELRNQIEKIIRNND